MLILPAVGAICIGKIRRLRWLRDIHTEGEARGVYIPKPPKPSDLTDLYH